MVQPWCCQFSNDSLSHVMKIAHKFSEVLMKPQFLEFLWLDTDFWEITGVRAENRKSQCNAMSRSVKGLNVMLCNGVLQVSM